MSLPVIGPAKWTVDKPSAVRMGVGIGVAEGTGVIAGEAVALGVGVRPGTVSVGDADGKPSDSTSIALMAP